MTRRPLSAVADRATRLRRRLRHVASERGETLIESLVSIGIVGIVVVALIGAVTLSGSLTTILRAQSASQSAGRSVYEAVSSFTVPKSTPLYSNGACNSTVTGQLAAVAQAAAANNSDVALNSAGITFGLVVVSVDSNAVMTQTVYPCTALAGHPVASAGEAATAIQVSLPVTAVGHSTVDKGNGNVVRTEATFPSVLKANVYQGTA
ncbi:MAG: type II secretion system protein [Actinomycetes bacterium]